MCTDPTDTSSPAQQSVAWAWLGAYAGLMSVLFAGIYLPQWFDVPEPGLKLAFGVPVTVAFLILYRGCVARHWPRWLRVPSLLALACGLFLWMVSSVAWGLLALCVEYAMWQRDPSGTPLQ